MNEQLTARRATLADKDVLLETLTLAFADDPVWRPSLTRPGDDPGAMRPFWEIWLRGAMRYPWTWMLGDGAAVSVWIPPGGSELSDEQNDEMTSLATTRLGADGAAALSEVFKRFEDAHPRAEAHYYLSLLGTHPAWRGRGLGIGLLETNLTVIDAEGVPSYLESSNSANDKRYQRLGYEPLRTFDLAAGQRVTGMWRSVGNGR